VLFPVHFDTYIGHSTTVEDSQCNWSIGNLLVTNSLQLNHFLLNSTMPSLMYIVIIRTFSLMQRSWRWMCWGRERWKRIWSDSYWRNRRYGVSSKCCHLWTIQIQVSYTRPRCTVEVIASKITATERECFGFNEKGFWKLIKDIPEIKTLKLKDMSDSFQS